VIRPVVAVAAVLAAALLAGVPVRAAGDGHEQPGAEFAQRLVGEVCGDKPVGSNDFLLCAEGAREIGARWVSLVRLHPRIARAGASAFFSMAIMCLKMDLESMAEYGACFLGASRTSVILAQRGEIDIGQVDWRQ
jgi:hypothetical protein